MSDVDFDRLNTLEETFDLYKSKSCNDIEEFLNNPEVFDREKIESLYLMADAYNYILDYIDRRIESFKDNESNL